MHSHEGHSHDDGHSHGATEQTMVQETKGGCSSGGCGCGNNATMMEADACGDASGSCGSGGCSDGGCGPGSEQEQRERAALQGFLTGLYVANLKREKMAEYFDNLAKAEGTEFQRPAQFLASVLTAMPSDPAAPNAHKATSTQLLEFITGENVE